MNANNANHYPRESSALCPFDDGRMNALIDCVKDNSTQIESLANDVKILSSYHQKIIKWLLMTVIFIALGNKAMEVFSKWSPSEVKAEVQNANNGR